MPTKMWITSTASLQIVAFISRKLFVWFSKGLFEVVLIFTRGLLPDRDCRSHCHKVKALGHFSN